MASGFNVVDFMDLPGFERCIVRLVLRETAMTYPQLQEAITTLPPEQKMDQAHLDKALEHLTRSQWLLRQELGQQPSYRVNTSQRGSRNRGLLDNLELESLDQSRSYKVDLEPAEQTLSVRRGGKRVLPAHIWDCLTDQAPEERSDHTPKRRTGMLNKLMDDDDG